MIEYHTLKQPKIEENIVPITLSDETMRQRKDHVLEKMKEAKLDVLVIYADVEHGGNFEYLCGFLPRFEEALLVLHQNGSAYMVLGNENLNKASKSRIPVTPIHMTHLSLPNQPMDTTKTIPEILLESDIAKANTIGLVGWKNFTAKLDDVTVLWDLPYFIVHALQTICPRATFTNAAHLFIGEQGVRTINNANEFAHYEFGAALAGNEILRVLNEIEIGKSEMELADLLHSYGQHHNVVTIMATGKRFENANMYPSQKTISLGDPISITTGYKGGLQSRGGYAIHDVSELQEEQKDYLQRVAFPYYEAVTTWLETIHIGMSGHELYDQIEAILPKKTYGWSLNPGHLCGDEEWLSSPIYPGSNEILRSGMLFQIDIIPSVPGYAGISCESGVLLADQQLQEAIQKEYPEVWKRIQERRTYMKEELGISLSQELLPTSMATAFCRPCLLNKDMACKVIKPSKSV